MQTQSDPAALSRLLSPDAPRHAERTVSIVGTTALKRLAWNLKTRLENSLLVFVIIMFFSIPAWAAPVSEPELFKQLLSDIQERLTHMQPADNRFPYHDLFADSCVETGQAVSKGDIIRVQSAQTGKISGLELRGAYGTGALTESSDDDGGLEGGRGNLELSWDILKQGYRQNALRAEAQELRAREADLHQGFDDLAQAYRCRHLKIDQVFASSLIKLLDLKLRLMQPVYRVERRAYFKHWSFLDDYLVSEADLTLTRHELRTLLSDTYYDHSPDHQWQPPIIDVDLPALLSAVRDDGRYDKLLSVEKEWLKLEHAADVRDSLRVYLRKEFDFDDGSENQDDIVAGLRFRVPLHKRKNNLLELKLHRAERENRRLLAQRIARCRNAHSEMQAQLRRTIKQRYRLARAEERLRRTLWRVGKNDEQSLTTAITRMRTVIESRLELVRSKKNLYQKVNRLFQSAQLPYRPELVTTIELQPEQLRSRPGTRSLYVWSAEFNRIDNHDILAFLEAKQISRVLLSVGRKTETDKRDRFLDLLQQNHIPAELIIGDNTWVFKSNHDKAAARSAIVAEKTGHLHFDIEPQAMSGYHDNREAYLSQFIELVKKTKLELMDRRLSIAVPFHWPAATYRELGTIADQLYVMAYGTDKPEVLIRRISSVLASVPAKQIVIALRADDFQDEWAFERMIEQLVSQTPVEQFAIQDLGSFIRKTASPYETEN